MLIEKNENKQKWAMAMVGHLKNTNVIVEFRAVDLPSGVGAEDDPLGGELEELGNVVEQGEEQDRDHKRLGRVDVSEKSLCRHMSIKVAQECVRFGPINCCKRL